VLIYIRVQLHPDFYQAASPTQPSLKSSGSRESTTSSRYNTIQKDSVERSVAAVSNVVLLFASCMEISLCVNHSSVLIYIRVLLHQDFFQAASPTQPSLKSPRSRESTTSSRYKTIQKDSVQRSVAAVSNAASPTQPSLKSSRSRESTTSNRYNTIPKDIVERSVAAVGNVVLLFAQFVAG
ncbi:hypothetical protein P5673_022262, partial [Acropora cervicornis]